MLIFAGLSLRVISEFLGTSTRASPQQRLCYLGFSDSALTLAVPMYCGNTTRGRNSVGVVGFVVFMSDLLVLQALEDRSYTENLRVTLVVPRSLLLYVLDGMTADLVQFAMMASMLASAINLSCGRPHL